ncbi:MAG: HD domain-containing protein [Gemmatimonadota bacterium]|nr:MAG: HD domain-containing protein [Gemmatimonadota bacterium]
MERLKIFVLRNFEKILVTCLLLIVVATHLFVVHKMVFLNIFFLPVLVSGFVLGRKGAILTSLLSIALVVYVSVIYPQTFQARGLATSSGNIDVVMGLILWGGFLTLAGYVVGTLYEQKEKKVHELRRAYTGILEILTKYLESADRYTKGHSLRVADTSTDIAAAMNLPEHEIENVRVAALLHDVGKIEISTDIIHKAASLTERERKIIESHSEGGARILDSMGVVLKESIPIVLAHHHYYRDVDSTTGSGRDQIPLGARIIAVADAFDAMVTDRPYRRGKPGWLALEEIERCAGDQFDPDVVRAFKSVFPEIMEVETGGTEAVCPMMGDVEREKRGKRPLRKTTELQHVIEERAKISRPA